MNRKTYPSDISREQFAPLLPLLESTRKRTAPRQIAAMLKKCYNINCFGLGN
jgi:ISXo3 transposase orfA